MNLAKELNYNRIVTLVMVNYVLEVINRDQIQELAKELIAPFDESCLTPLGYDLCVGKKVIIFPTQKEEQISESSSITIPPGARFAVESLEKIELPNNMFAFVFTKVSILWEGLTSLGTKVDPFFQDNLMLIFSNDSSKPFTIRYGQKICNLMFFRYGPPPQDVKSRGRPSFLIMPSYPPAISDAMDDEAIKGNFGYGIFSVIKYLRPKIKKHRRRIRRLEKFRRRLNYVAAGIITSVISGIILWLIKGG